MGSCDRHGAGVGTGVRQRDPDLDVQRGGPFGGGPAQGHLRNLCAGCHLEPQGKSEEEKRLVELLKKGTDLAWKPLFRQPAHVFYSHRRHVIAAKLQCLVCHGAIADTTAPPVRVRRLVMNDCVSCHRKAHVSTDCTACHR